MQDFARTATVVNILDEPFSHPFGGQSIPPAGPLQPGEAVILPYTVAEHFAKHMARRYMVKKADSGRLARDEKLWDEVTIKKLIDQILGSPVTREMPAVMTEAQRIAKDVAELNKFKKDLVDETEIALDDKESVPKAPVEYKDKKEVIEELKKLNMPVDARLSKAKLEQILAQALSNMR